MKGVCKVSHYNLFPGPAYKGESLLNIEAVTVDLPANQQALLSFFAPWVSRVVGDPIRCAIPTFLTINVGAKFPAFGRIR
jgi:hypothetical protein